MRRSGFDQPSRFFSAWFSGPTDPAISVTRLWSRLRCPKSSLSASQNASALSFTSAIAFARYSDGAFGWRVVDPGHGLSFASTRRPLDAVAAAPLAAAGSYGPLLVVERPAPLPRALQEYLLDIQPGYTDDPVRGVYNHGWVIGDEQAISIPSQAQIDQLLEIAPVAGGSSPAP